MMKTYLKRAFQLSDSGVKGLAKSIWSFFLYYVSFVPPMICVFLFADRLLNGNTGKPVVYLLFMLAATLVMYLVINYNYKTTYDETYQESATLRIDLAEQLSKLPLFRNIRRLHLLRVFVKSDIVLYGEQLILNFSDFAEVFLREVGVVVDDAVPVVLHPAQRHPIRGHRQPTVTVHFGIVPRFEAFG